jgi:hypothetical protein
MGQIGYGKAVNALPFFIVDEVDVYFGFSLIVDESRQVESSVVLFVDPEKFYIAAVFYFDG